MYVATLRLYISDWEGALVLKKADGLKERKLYVCLSLPLQVAILPGNLSPHEQKTDDDH